MSPASPWRRAESAAGHPGLTDALGGLEGSALASLLLEVAARQAARRNPAEILRQAATDPFTAPCDLDQRRLLALDAAVAAALPAAFDAVELSPLCPLGTVSQLAVAHQNKVLATSRQTEVLADPTNAMALLVAARRAKGQAVVRLCTTARVVRTPRVEKAGFTQHFRLWAFVTGGRDTGGRAFEQSALREHLGLHQTVLQTLRAAGLPIPEATAQVAAGEGHQGWVAAAIGADAPIGALQGSYYQGVRMNLLLPLGDQRLPISDGGLVDWVAKLRSDRKERLFISAIGTELLVRLYRPETG